VPYFHVVFTVPSQIEVIAFQNQTVVYDILFRVALMIARRLLGCSPCLPVALRNVPSVHRQRVAQHSIPIALAAGGAV
jgi:hypothetical protein